MLIFYEFYQNKHVKQQRSYIQIIMGCNTSSDVHQHSLKTIKQPEGKPIDPLTAEGDIVDIIINDPHIDYYQKKITESLMNAKREKQKLSQNKQNFPQKKDGKKEPLKIQRFATADKKEHQAYVKTVNAALQGNDASVTNIMEYMIGEMADMRQGQKAKDKFLGGSYAALKCFVYLYTGHYSYKKINSQLRRNQYDKIIKVIAVVQKQLEQYNKQKFSRKLKANLKFGKILNLYRGINKPDKSMLKGQRLYWKSFTSTSLDTTVASRFGRYTYVISLESNNPHPYMIVPEQLSQFKEQEIILFPYFYFQCQGSQNFTSGARYQCKQMPPAQQ